MLKEKEKQRKLRQSFTWVGLPLVAVVGWFYPWIGFLLLGCMLGAVGVAVFRGRAWCDWMCPRGAFYDLFIRPLSRRKIIPAFLRSRAVRVFMLGLIFVMIGVQWYLAKGDGAAMGLALVRILTITTIAGIILGLIIHPRAWCHICPMGTLSYWLSKGKEPLFISQSCVDCRACARICPMQLMPYKYRSDGIMGDNDCIKCGSCVAICPSRALSFGSSRALF
ncbi:4Fe-4S binding protein [Thermodesulfitimonas autotrophica]|uniref:4Fe-4S binding protein n=1 Tax=Thermodesulfitimonas autotrophica TaxID=1894989 RepID=A0A3N5AZH1_9THEO|nr:4Fe-4S binding protein [Thermodesulfitimonas autotrophica]RPF42578.1 4Fe-4S binding protein [Thermodesulfitimonas autotrophica]